ncbi:MAG: mechanosensitive ion channel family protein [Thermoleophilaceae bacterium]
MLDLVAAATPQQLQRSCGDEPGLICRKVLDWTGSEALAEVARWLLDVPLKIALIVVGALVAAHLLRRLVKRGLRRLHDGALRERIGAVRRRSPNALLETGETNLRAEQRIDALTSVLRSAVTFVVWLIAGFMILGELGISLGPLLAGAGVLGVALGFGSQALVRDFLSGMFILVEDQFGVGDIVDFDGQTSGVVEAVSLRTTRVRSVDGTVWHVPNGEVRRVGNMSQHWSRALLDVEVAYDTDLEAAKRTIKEAADAIWREDRDVLEEPELWGVEQLGPSSVVIRLVVKTTPAEQWRVSRELRERIKGALDAAGIEIPFPQQVVWHRGAEPPAPDPPGVGEPS